MLFIGEKRIQETQNSLNSISSWKTCDFLGIFFIIFFVPPEKKKTNMLVRVYRWLGLFGTQISHFIILFYLSLAYHLKINIF